MDLLPQGNVSKHFKWKEALFIPQWNTCHIPSQAEKDTITRTAGVMDKIRSIIGAPINVHCWIRPVLNNPKSPWHGDDYNERVGGALKSMHKSGGAVDFSVAGKSCDSIRDLLKPRLAELGCRMENLPGSAWVHIDIRDVASDNLRFFKP